VARRCEYDPAFQWLTGLDEVNYHTLADFRVDKQKELDELFTQVLASLSKEGLITLEQVMQDGTKIKALASTRSFQRQETIQGHLERARQRVAEMGDPRNEDTSPKAKHAQARARREQQERLERALEELQKLQARKSGEKAKSDARVSTSDPEARVHEAVRRWISAQLQRADFYRRSERTDPRSHSDAGSQRQRAVVAGGGAHHRSAGEKATTDGGRRQLHGRATISRRWPDKRSISWEAWARRDAQWNNHSEPHSARRIPLSAGTNRYVCPEGKLLRPQGRFNNKKMKGLAAYRYEAKSSDCAACIRKPECCRKIGAAVADCYGG